MSTNRGESATNAFGIEAAELDWKPAILVLEDQEQVRSLIASMLMIRGLPSEMAASVAEARELLGKRSYDIIFLDVGLPDGSGLSILEGDGREGPLVVVVTGANDITAAIEAIRRGAVDYIAKPFTVGQFLQRVDRVLEQWRFRVRCRFHERSLETLVRIKVDELSRTTHEMNTVYDMVVAALGAALNLKDHETESHCRRVSENSARLGRSLELSTFELRNLTWSAYLHDVGKIGIPERILLKRGELLPEERRIVEQHPILGFDLLKNIEFLSYATDVVISHHERFDGTGYPHRRTGTDIPLHARIFAVVDTLDAMTSDRPYRGARPFREAVAELERLAGQHYDPEIVGRFLRLPESSWLVQTTGAV